MDEVKFDATVAVELDNDSNCSSADVEAIEAAEAELEAEYETYAAECKAAMRLALSRIKNIREAVGRTGRRNPFDRIEKRIKTFKSAKGKCRARGYELNIRSIRENVKDVAGIRVITKYMDDVMVVKDMIAQFPGINIVTVKDYVTMPKKNGYQSVHLGCQIEIHDPFKGSQLVPLEIQIRSKSMNLWAALEHDLKYKNENPNPEVEEMFRNVSKILRNLDEEIIRLRDYEEVAETNKRAMTSSIYDISSPTVPKASGLVSKILE
ncbi:hypothetical protein IJG27_01655 [Candidatus Saccharibacteria bacterium]|nr:hypothetical protein [Candidatus Saccharibacteria bacterium]